VVGEPDGQGGKKKKGGREVGRALRSLREKKLRPQRTGEKRCPVIV